MKKSFLIIPVLLIIGLSLQAYLSATFSTDGDKLAKIQAQIAALSNQNQALRSEILFHTSLEAVQAYALENSMKPATITNLTAITVASLTP